MNTENNPAGNMSADSMAAAMVTAKDNAAKELYGGTLALHQTDENSGRDGNIRGLGNDG